MMIQKNVCKLCKEKLELRDNDAMYYCKKCNEKLRKERRGLKWQK